MLLYGKNTNCSNGSSSRAFTWKYSVLRILFNRACYYNLPLVDHFLAVCRRSVEADFVRRLKVLILASTSSALRCFVWMKAKVSMFLALHVTAPNLWWRSWCLWRRCRGRERNPCSSWDWRRWQGSSSQSDEPIIRHDLCDDVLMASTTRDSFRHGYFDLSLAIDVIKLFKQVALVGVCNGSLYLASCLFSHIK